MKHTPGPWRVIIDDDGNPLSGRPSVVAADEYDCAIVHWDGFVQTYWQSARGEKEIHANAKLIAAAPELLEVVKDFMENPLYQVAVGGNPTMVDEFMTRARAVIAKATQ